MNKALIQTERLLLRELLPDDTPHFFRLNADPEVLHYTGDTPFADLAEARVFLQNYDAFQKYGMGRWAAVEKATQSWLGWCGLKYHEDGGWVDLGFRFLREYWGQGYFTEAAGGSLAFGFGALQLPEIVGRSQIKNRASVWVLEKVGMQFVGTEWEGSLIWHRYVIRREEYIRKGASAI